jgi:hypothetical protein
MQLQAGKERGHQVRRGKEGAGKKINGIEKD